ncbi:CrcB protein [Curtobacterium pusillum]|uniref:Fluoride-specific ion channel FluC n=1 Tax=Curtobacterium pusillum TaxID=69373 RepID=A0AAW3TAJ4_9MICO|nr:CrcB family protein [Curtobacterium pusillum]MBA8992084.1 CrcB protein [Curtobacterium pusillum]
MTTRTDTPMPDDLLPPDPDVDVSDPRPVTRPVHLRWRYLGLVAVGGAVGTALRDVISSLLPADGGVSWSIFWINIAGALLLGLLLEALAHRGPDQGRRRILRLLLGTGALGGFTTYSTLAESTSALFFNGHGLAGTGYALLTILSGAIATACGLVVASWIRPREVRA